MLHNDNRFILIIYTPHVIRRGIGYRHDVRIDAIMKVYYLGTNNSLTEEQYDYSLI